MGAVLDQKLKEIVILIDFQATLQPTKKLPKLPKSFHFSLLRRRKKYEF